MLSHRAAENMSSHVYSSQRIITSFILDQNFIIKSSKMETLLIESFLEVEFYDVEVRFF